MAAGREGYGVQSDVWSLGITIVEIATGRFPYPEWNCVIAQLDAVINGDPPILTPKDGFSQELVVFVRDCLVKDPELRPNYEKLLKYPFIVQSLDRQVDVAGYVTRVLKSEWIQFDE